MGQPNQVYTNHSNQSDKSEKIFSQQEQQSPNRQQDYQIHNFKEDKKVTYQANKISDGQRPAKFSNKDMQRYNNEISKTQDA